MTDKPILFSGEMVRAILEGSKTMTRRVVMPQPSYEYDHAPHLHNVGDVCLSNLTGWPLIVKRIGRFGKTASAMFPYGVAGDRLWVRETFLDASKALAGRVLYRADGDSACAWRPSIFMPRELSRITLEIINIRVERVQDIDANDALAEGVSHTPFWQPKDVESRPFEEQWWDDFYFWSHYPQIAFRALWDSINAKRGFDWNVNPWVWVIEFKRLS